MRVSLGRRVLRLWLLLTHWCRPLARLFQPASSITSYVVGLSFPSTLFSIPVLVPVPAPSMFPPCSHHRFLPLVLDAMFSPLCHIVGQAPNIRPKASGYQQAPHHAYRDDAACGMVVPGLSLFLFSYAADTRVLLLSPFPLHSRSRSRPFFSPRSHSRILTRLRYSPRFPPHFRPRPRLAILLSPPPPTSFQTPPLTSFPSLFAPSRFSEMVTPSAECACTGTRPCKRSF